MTVRLKNAGTVQLVLAFFLLTAVNGRVFCQKIGPIVDADWWALYQQNIPLTHLDNSIISIAAVGDLMMSSWIIDVVKEHGVHYPFDSTRAMLSSADIAIANLEAPLTAEGESFKDKKYTFKVPPYFVEGIAAAGIDVVTMANNHIVDFGCAGLTNSIETLDRAGITHCGAGENRGQACAPAFVDVNGMRIGFIGFSMTFPQEFWATPDSCGTCYPTDALLVRSITESEHHADFTIVSFHWGSEKRTDPRKYQIDFARKAIDLGADLVLGHHPHVLQGLELYKGKLIAYSLGNYVFASYSNTAKTSIILKAKIDDYGLIMARVIPINVHNATIQFQPTLLKGEAGHRLLHELDELSQPLNGGASIIDNDGYILPARPATASAENEGATVVR